MQLQQRVKLKQKQSNGLQPGTIVALRDNNQSPLNKQLGKILYPGNDSITRVMTVKVSTGVVKRAVTKICF